jgi:hypothetical protein
MHDSGDVGLDEAKCRMSLSISKITLAQHFDVGFCWKMPSGALCSAEPEEPL